MLKNIYLNNHLSFKKKFKNLFRYIRRRRAGNISWRKKFKAIKKRSPHYLKKIDSELEKSHINYWSNLNKNINLQTLRVATNISGKSNIKYVPEEIFFSEIEPTLNKVQLVKFLEIKNFYNKWFGDSARFPQTYLNKVDGEFFDQKFNRFKKDKVLHLINKIEKPLVLKSSKDTYGGFGVYLSPGKNKILELLEEMPNVVIQERLTLDTDYCHISGLKPVSTRLLMYRSVSDNKWRILSNQLRMAVGDSLDNTSSGGIVTCINSDGIMDGFATDGFGKRYDRHPDTGIRFNLSIAAQDEMSDLAKSVCLKIPYVRLVALDLIYDHKKTWRMIEINLFSLTIRNAQYHGQPVFGDFTDEVLEYCISNHWALSNNSH